MTKASCPRTNDTSLHCEHGCCGNSSNQKCCTFQLSETVIIVTCVVGALAVFISVMLLVLCITKKKKDAVTRIQPRRRPQQAHQERRRQPAAEMPKPPPYSEAPPEYNSLNHISRHTTMAPARTDTEYERPLPLRSGRGRNIRHSPQPSTSGGTPISLISNDITNYQVNTRTEARLNNDNENLRKHQRNNNLSEQRNDLPWEEEHRQIANSQLHPSGNISSRKTHQESASNMEKPVMPVLKNIQPSKAHTPGYKDKKVNGIELPGIVGILPESPRPTNQAAAGRSAKRQAVLQHLESRRMRQLDMSLSSSSDED